MKQTEAWKSWPTPSLGDDLEEFHNWRCAWCGYDKDRLVRDHCHMTGLIRGLLCSGCNTQEGMSSTGIWDGWRAGDNPAWAVRHFEIYRNHMGVTPYSSQSALHWYDHAERAAWFDLSVQYLRDGRIEWPTDAPWLDTALERKAEAYRQFREISDKWDFLLPGNGEPAA